MRRPSAGLMAACLLAGLAGSASAQEPVEGQIPTAGAGQRLEFEEPGFAVTIPSDWELELRRSDVEGETHWASARDDVGLPSEQGCTFSTGGISAARLAMSRTVPGRPLEWLDLPGGRALLVEEEVESPWPRHRYFIFDRGANSYQIGCYALVMPNDGWMSIAASFEFLSHDPHVVPIHSGVTMTFPIEWNVLEDRGQMPGAPGWEKVLWATDGASICQVANDTRVPDPDSQRTAEELRAEYLGYLSQRSAEAVDPVEVDLPVGPAWRADWMAGQEDGYRTDHSLYQVSIGETSVRLACLAYSEPPTDRWLAIAETIELVPAA